MEADGRLSFVDLERSSWVVRKFDTRLVKMYRVTQSLCCGDQSGRLVADHKVIRQESGHVNVIRVNCAVPTTLLHSSVVFFTSSPFNGSTNCVYPLDAI